MGFRELLNEVYKMERAVNKDGDRFILYRNPDQRDIKDILHENKARMFSNPGKLVVVINKKKKEVFVCHHTLGAESIAKKHWMQYNENGKNNMGDLFLTGNIKNNEIDLRGSKFLNSDYEWIRKYGIVY